VKPPGGSKVTVLGQQHLDDLAVLVSRPVQIRPPSGGLHANLVGEPTVTGRMQGEPAPPR
jgi:hypothetical protein